MNHSTTSTILNRLKFKAIDINVYELRIPSYDSFSNVKLSAMIFKHAFGIRKTFILSLICLLFLQLIISNNLYGQKVQLAPSGKVSKIAFIDQTALRKRFNSYQETIRYLNNKFALIKKNYSDSITKFGKSDHAKSLINSNYSTLQRELHLEKIRLFKSLEEKINSAIHNIVSSGGYTDIRLVEQKNPGERGIDITTEVIHILNSN